MIFFGFYNVICHKIKKNSKNIILNWNKDTLRMVGYLFVTFYFISDWFPIDRYPYCQIHGCVTLNEQPSNLKTIKKTENQMNVLYIYFMNGNTMQLDIELNIFKLSNKT